LSALSSSKASTGFLRDRNLRPVSLGKVVVDYGTWKDDVKLFARRRPRTIRKEFEKCPLNKRAWPLQEKILAPAVVHFGRDQLIWECNTNHLYSETGAKEDWGGVVIRTSDMMGARYPLNLKNLWDCVVDEFTQRKLTLAKDRLPAVLGMASRLRQDGTRTGRYVAGLWENDLEFQLMWYATNSSETNYGDSAQPNLHISTWSWAHRNVQVYTSFRSGLTNVLTKTPRFFFENPEEERQSRDSKVTVPSCAIMLGGYVQKVGATAINVDSRPGRQLWTDTADWSGLPGTNSRWMFDHEPLPPTSFKCLRVLEDAQGSEWSTPSIEYLVLRETQAPDGRFGPSYDGALGKVYSRVGFLCLTAMPSDHYVQPYPSIYFENKKPLLIHGQWEEIVLMENRHVWCAAKRTFFPK